MIQDGLTSMFYLAMAGISVSYIVLYLLYSTSKWFLMIRLVFLTFTANVWMNFMVVVGERCYKLFSLPMDFQKYIVGPIAWFFCAILLMLVTTLIHNFIIELEHWSKKKDEEKNE
jgi:hypothetical protein